MPTAELMPQPNGAYYCPQDPGEPGGGKRVSVTDAEGKILADLVEGKRVLEIGTGLGVSTRHMASTARIVYTMDIDPWVRENIWPALEEVSFVVTVESLDEVRKPEVAFIDGRHTEDQVDKDIQTAIEAGCTTIIGHDICSENVKKGFARHFDKVEIIKTTYGIGVAHIG